jgi:hypothetical protein
MAIAFCPDCEEGVSLGPQPRIGQRVVCPHCRAELEVIDLSPLELDWAYDDSDLDWDEEEEWDEEEWDDDEGKDDWDEEEADD